MSRAPYKPSDLVDFVVIGSGAAGGAVAKELSTAGFDVVVLEQGPYLRAKDFKHDEVGIRYLHALTNDPKLQPNTFRKTEADAAKIQTSVSYGRQVGGGTVHFTGNYWRFHQVDFQERSRWGALPGASLEDWPIAYEDLEPYYTRAEEEVGVSGLAGSSPFDPPRSKPYPLPPLPVKSSGVLFERAAKKLGLHPYPAPMAILSQPYRGRAACSHCGFCQSFGCEMNAKSSTLASVIPVAEKTGHCEIRTESYVRKIEIDAQGRVTGATYFDAHGREAFQRAKAVVVCANGAETPRLLLMSKSNLFPQGLANSSGMVGRNLMFNTGTVTTGLFEHPLNEYKSVQVTRLIHDYYDSDAKRGFFGGGGIDARFSQTPIGFGLNGVPGMPRWGSAWKKAAAHNYPRLMALSSDTTCLAVEGNSISLDPEVKDHWGLPAMRVTFKNHPDDMKVLQFISDRQTEIMRAMEPVEQWSRPIREVTGSAHLMGTCRMGNDPKRSVVDRWHRTHDVPNLFLVDGSSFVTSGRQQPTFTIQALAFRAGEHLAQMAKRGEI